MTLTSDLVILHTVVHHSLTSTYINIKETSCARTDASVPDGAGSWQKNRWITTELFDDLLHHFAEVGMNDELYVNHKKCHIDRLT